MRLCLPGARPSADDLAAFARGATAAPSCTLPGSIGDDSMPEGGWYINRHQRPIGRGRDAYRRATAALASLDCLELGWLTHRCYADCLAICSRQLGVFWVFNANRIYARHERGARACSVSWITPRRHVLAGEERLSVTWDGGDDGEVRFEVLSFSRPRHIISWATYPLVRAQQARFARDATRLMRASCQSVL